MGSFTKRLTRKRTIPIVAYRLTDEVLGRWVKLEEADRSFALRQLATDEADGSDAQFRRAVYLIGGRRPSGREVFEWWTRIGPRGRQAVRLCFYSAHAPDAVPSTA